LERKYHYKYNLAQQMRIIERKKIKTYTYHKEEHLKPYQLLFVAVVKSAIKYQDTKFLFKYYNLEWFAQGCGVDQNSIEGIRQRAKPLIAPCPSQD